MLFDTDASTLRLLAETIAPEPLAHRGRAYRNVIIHQALAGGSGGSCSIVASEDGSIRCSRYNSENVGWFALRRR